MRRTIRPKLSRRLAQAYGEGHLITTAFAWLESMSDRTCVGASTLPETALTTSSPSSNWLARYMVMKPTNRSMPFWRCSPMSRTTRSGFSCRKVERSIVPSAALTVRKPSRETSYLADLPMVLDNEDQLITHARSLTIIEPKEVAAARRCFVLSEWA